nr:RNA (guanine 9) methyltransferase [Hymenolepis microstoma]
MSEQTNSLLGKSSDGIFSRNEDSEANTEDLHSKEQIRSNDSGSDEPPSKRQKLTKMDRYRLKKEERRERRKAMKQRRREKRDAAIAAGKTPPQHPRRQRVSMANSTCRTCVVLDCSFDNLMSFKDICKFAHQLSNCYSTNRNLPAPVQLYVTGLGSAFDQTDPISKDVEKRIPKTESTLARLNIVDAKNWDVHLKMEDYTELFPASSIVYLCAESPYELPDKFEPAEASASSANKSPVFTADDVYVIGGLVDHNHHNGLCYEQACKRGYRTARLPLERAGISVEGRRVLSLLHVFQALAFVLSTAQPDWSSALRDALPPRKINKLSNAKTAPSLNNQSNEDETDS